MIVKLVEPYMDKNYSIQINLSECELSEHQLSKIENIVKGFVNTNKNVFLQSSNKYFYMVEYWTDDINYINETSQNLISKVSGVL